MASGGFFKPYLSNNFMPFSFILRQFQDVVFPRKIFQFTKNVYGKMKSSEVDILEEIISKILVQTVLGFFKWN